MPDTTKQETIHRDATVWERQQLQRYLLRKWRSDRRRSADKKRRDAQHMVRMARIHVNEWEDDAALDCNKLMSVIWHKGPVALQAFTSLGNGALKQGWTSRSPVPSPSLGQRLRLVARWLTTLTGEAAR